MDGDVPNGWREAPLGRLCEPPEYGCGEPAVPFVEGTPRYIRITDITESGRLTTTDFRSAALADPVPYLLADGDLVFARSGATVGKTYMYSRADGPAVFAGYLIRFRALPEAVLPEYLYQITRSAAYRRWVHTTLRAGAQPNVNATEYASMPVRYPSIAEQRSITNVLDAIDDSIEKTEAVIAATEELRKALLQELLTRGVPGWHTEWKSVPGIGEVPACWEVVRLGDKIAVGPSNGLYKPESDYGSGTWIIRIGDFEPGRLVRHQFDRVRLTASEAAAFAVSRGDVLINRVNSLSHIGKSTLIPPLAESAVFESNMMRLTPVESLSSDYLLAVLCSPLATRHFVARAKKAVAQCSINQTDVRDLSFPMPPASEQHAVVEWVRQMDLVLERSGYALMELRNAKSLIAAALLSGRVRVPKGGEVPT